MDKVLVLGGTGVMGRFLVDLLSEHYYVIATTRRKLVGKGNIAYEQGDAHNNVFLEKLLSGNNYKAIVDFMHYSTEEFKIRYKLLLDHTEQLIYISSARVYAESKGLLQETNSRLLDVSRDQLFLKTDDYALAKARQEDILKESGKKNWTIVRPYMTYSEKKLDLGIYSKELWLYRVVNGRSIVFTEDVAQSFTTLTYGEDVAKSIYSLCGNENAKGKTIHITSDESKKWIDIIALYKKLLESRGYELKVIMLPKSEQPLENIYRYDRCYDRVFDNSVIKHFIGTTPFIPLEDGLTKSLNRFLDNPKWEKIDWKKQAYWDRITKERTPLSEIGCFKDRLLYYSFRYLISYSFVYNLIHWHK